MSSTKFRIKRVQGERIIYTASLFAKQNLFYLQEIGYSQYLEPYISKRGELSSFLFFIVQSGSGKLMYHDTKYEVGKGQCVFINCKEKYVLSSDDDSMSLAWIHFNGLTMFSVHQKFIERCGGPCFSVKDSDFFIKHHKRIFASANEKSYVKDMELMSLISALLTDIMEQCWHNTVAPRIPIKQNEWNNIRQYVENNYTSNITLDDLSKTFAINKYYLLRQFKEAYGITINQYIINLRITHAKEMLRFSDISLTEIAFKAGFNDSAYFSRTFKKLEGISPSEFRKQWNAY